MQIVIHTDGNCRCLYGEDVDLRVLGSLYIQRASHLEPDSACNWYVDLSPVRGPKLGPFAGRCDALAAEVAWLEANRL